MPNIKSASKRMRQNVKRRLANRARRSAMRTAIKRILGSMNQGDAESAQQQIRQTLSIIGDAAQKRLIHKNKAARYASRLTRRLNALGSQDTSAS